MAGENDLTELHFSCACNKVCGSVGIPSSKLPLLLSFCHCNICRHQTGLLAGSYVLLPKESTSFKVSGPLASYRTSSRMIRRFCSSCGSNVYVEGTQPGEIHICSGAMGKSESKVLLRDHIFVPDTKDGGLSSWLPNVPGWEGFSHESKQIDCSLQTKAATNNTPSGQLRGYCQCRGVQFTITPPNEASKNLRGPFADLLAPYVSCSPKNDADVKWWLRSKDTRFLAGTCACNSCRKASGFDVQTWAFIPRVNISNVHGKPINPHMGSLKQYRSSEGVYREFCGICGAKVFWHCDARPDLIDVSVGLLDAEEGARAESWLEWWTERVSFEEEAQNTSIISSLKAGLKMWGDAKTPMLAKDDRG